MRYGSKCLAAIALLYGLLAAGPAVSAQNSPAATDDAAREEILSSPAWRRAMFEVNDWLTTQPLYTPEQVAQMREQFRQRIDAMDAGELKLLLGDLQTKLQLLDTPQAREARAWMAEYVAVMSDQKRDQVLRDLPNLSQLTSGQLHQELLRIKQKRARLDNLQSAHAQGQANRVAAQLSANQVTPAARNRSVPRTNTLSPYRSQSNVNDRLNAPPNQGSFFVNAFGGIGRTLPGGW